LKGCDNKVSHKKAQKAQKINPFSSIFVPFVPFCGLDLFEANGAAE
jgi:hypothetical protein